MIFRNPFKEIEGLMKRPHNPISGFQEDKEHVEIFVEKKLGMGEIYTHVMDDSQPWDVDDIAPKMVNGKPVKVTEIGEVWAQQDVPSSLSVSEADRNEYNPIPGGCMMQPTGAPFRGTLGIVGVAPRFGGKYLVGSLRGFKGILDALGISYSWEPVIVTNAHVAQLDVMNQKVGHKVSQPLGVEHIVGNVLWSQAFKASKNYIDAAVCSVHSPALKNEILEVGHVLESRHPRVGEEVHKYGSTTRYTEGSCVREKAVVNVRYGPDLVIPFYNVHLFSGMSAKGDSGSVIVAKEDGRAVSLLFAGNNQVTMGCSLQEVEKKSGVRIGNEE